MSVDMLRYEVWLEKDDVSGTTVIVVTGLELGGQSVIVGSREFGRYTPWSTMSNWVWAQMQLDSDAYKV